MNYRDILVLLSDCHLGAILAAENNIILDINDCGCQLLHADPDIRGNPLEEAAPFLCNPTADTFGNPDFDCYLTHVATLTPEHLPPNTRLLVFRDAGKEFKCNLLENVFNHVSDAITLWDSNGRMLMLNDAAVKLEAHVGSNVLGRHSSELYQTKNGSILVIPHMIENKKPVLNLRQDFSTHTGKDLQIVSNNYPILQGGEVVGAISIMDDYTEMDSMSRQIIDLQRQLMNQSKRPSAAKESILPAKYHFKDIVYTSKAMHTTLDRCKQVAQSDSPVMIYGETGTGKELFAQSIHNASPRANGPFLAVNCAAIPTTLLESILFGTEKGAYTGSEKREGLFEQAHTGTILLDEINSMDITLQSKLLRVLQEGSFRRVGGSKLIHVDVRVLSNINITPMEAMEQGLLRHDLYYRLGVININIPPLRQRKEDIPLLAKNFIMNMNQRLLKNAVALSPMAASLFHEYDWPGNVRELQHAIEYALNIIPKEMDLITPEYIPDHILSAVGYEHREDEPTSNSMTLDGVLQEAGYRFLYNALAEHQGNISQTAKALGLSRQNLQQKLKKFGVRGSK
ncbi:MAG: sigma-54 interaction domain-containing protein [Butyricicoccus sp.]